MQYHGFPSISVYESECARLGYKTRRVPFTGPAGECFALITAPPGHPTGTSIESWTLFSANESAQLLDGVINGHSGNYLGKLAAHGYFPLDEQAPSLPAVESSLTAADDGQLCFSF